MRLQFRRELYEMFRQINKRLFPPPVTSFYTLLLFYFVFVLFVK